MLKDIKNYLKVLLFWKTNKIYQKKNVEKNFCRKCQSLSSVRFIALFHFTKFTIL